jgi:TolA-binding protein
VLEGFAGSPKASSAQLHKGFALLKLNKRTDGIHELRLLIERHPQTPEATEARNRLASLGIHVR